MLSEWILELSAPFLVIDIFFNIDRTHHNLTKRVIITLLFIYSSMGVPDHQSQPNGTTLPWCIILLLIHLLNHTQHLGFFANFPNLIMDPVLPIVWALIYRSHLSMLVPRPILKWPSCLSTLACVNTSPNSIGIPNDLTINRGKKLLPMSTNYLTYTIICNKN